MECTEVAKKELNGKKRPELKKEGKVCPQHLPIRNLLKDVAKRFES